MNRRAKRFHVIAAVETLEFVTDGNMQRKAVLKAAAWMRIRTARIRGAEMPDFPRRQPLNRGRPPGALPGRGASKGVSRLRNRHRRTGSICALSLAAVLGILPLAAVRAEDPPAKAARQETASGASAPICLIMESAANANQLPLEFLVRLIWRESSFNTDAVGPPTRSGERAAGIAQFMPRTASERQLLDPFDPIQAIPKAAEFLHELRTEFGNLGLAAAAYNAGPRRVRDWIAGRGVLPSETQHYVEAITGGSVDEWVAGGISGEAKFDPRPSCEKIMSLLRQTPTPFMDQLQQHVTASATSPWGVELSAGFSREHAVSSYAMIERQHRDILGSLDMIIMRTTFRSRGTRPFYQVRAGANSRASANELCTRLHGANIGCIVLRNKG